MKVKFLFFFFCYVYFFSMQSSKAGGFFYTSLETLNCISENHSAYSALKDDPLLIFVRECPKTEPALDRIIDEAENTLNEIQVDTGGSVNGDSWLYIEKRELYCLPRVLGTIQELHFRGRSGDYVAKIGTNFCELM